MLTKFCSLRRSSKNILFFHRYFIHNLTEATNELNENINNNNNNDLNQNNDLNINVSNIERGVPKSLIEYNLRKKIKVDQPDMARFCRVAILGAPNAGKSTLTNALVGIKVSSVSNKVHTTRHKILGVIIQDETQVEFLDTPGVVTQKHCFKHKLEPTFMTDPVISTNQADLLIVVNDVTNLLDRNRINPGIIQILNKHIDKQSILVLNKIDKVKEKRHLLHISTRLTCGIVGGFKSVSIKKPPHSNSNSFIKNIISKTEARLGQQQNHKSGHESDDEYEYEDEQKDQGWPHFSRVFYVSARNNDGVDDIKKYLIEQARFKDWSHHRTFVTDQSPHEIAKNIIWEKCLDLFQKEAPYNIKVKINNWDIDQLGNLHILITLYCLERHQSMVIGPQGKNISYIVEKTKFDLQNTFHCDVNLKIAVKGVKSINT